jgi:hypothetical protein
MELVLTRDVADIKQLSPFRHRNGQLASCKAITLEAADRWAYYDPNDLSKTRKLSWTTFEAILKRGGGPYQGYDFLFALWAIHSSR